jgi:hypothetical protein
MPFTILTGKELAICPKPMVLCRIVAVDGGTIYLCTTPAQGGATLVYGGNTYQARIQEQVVDAIQAMSPQGYDIPGTVNLKIADGTLSIWANHANLHGWRGGTLTMTFVLWDIPTNAYSTDAFVWDFILGKPNISAAGVISVEATARISMARLKIPNVPRSRRCPWDFPATSAQRSDALNDPSSAYYPCGYSPDQAGGVGNYQTGTTPFTTCDLTRASCVARGMFSTDSSARATGHFGGDTWQAPAQYNGRQYTSGQKIYGFNVSTFGPGQYYPIVFGTQWVDGLVLEPAAEPNSLRAEVVLSVAYHGAANVLKLLVNGVEVPYNNRDVLFTWRYVNSGGRNGHINTDAIFDATGDPHGSQCCIEFVVPLQLAAGGSVPHVQALLQGPPIAVYSDATTRTFAYTDNPVWHLVELLTQGPWLYSQLDMQTFVGAAAICDVAITYTDLNGNTGASHARYRSGFSLTGANRQTLAQAVAGVRANAGIILARNPTNGLLQCFIEQTLGDAQPAPVAGSNYNTAVASLSAAGAAKNGFVAYLFDGAGSIEKGTFLVGGRSISDTPNRVFAQFQDEDNKYQQDSVSTIDPQGYVSSGNQEIDIPLQVLGAVNFDQLTRRSNVELAKALRGNVRDDAGGTEIIEFTASVNAVHLASKVGAICGITYQQLGF